MANVFLPVHSLRSLAELKPLWIADQNSESKNVIKVFSKTFTAERAASRHHLAKESSNVFLKNITNLFLSIEGLCKMSNTVVSLWYTDLAAIFYMLGVWERRDHECFWSDDALVALVSLSQSWLITDLTIRFPSNMLSIVDDKCARYKHSRWPNFQILNMLDYLPLSASFHRCIPKYPRGSYITFSRVPWQKPYQCSP